MLEAIRGLHVGLWAEITGKNIVVRRGRRYLQVVIFIVQSRKCSNYFCSQQILLMNIINGYEQKLRCFLAAAHNIKP